MSIRIDVVRIAGFRGIENLEITLPRIALLIGTNNSGKTSVIKALQLALGDYARYIADEDFHIDKNEKRYEQILVDIRIIPVDQSDDRKQRFNEEWLDAFGDKIQAEANGNQFLALRSQCFPDKIKGGFIVHRYALERWPIFNDWQDEKPSDRRKLHKRYDAIPFIPIDAQRDIHQELSEKSSFVGRVLSSIDYNEDDIQHLEEMVASLNKDAVEKSEPLKKLKVHLDTLNQSFQDTGHVEITPFPKKVRDLSKNFSIHFGESQGSSFSMEYHGMGTRSWASMLTVKAFTELTAQKHEKEYKPFFPILAAEEPEAHLHPNAQKTLYQQLANTKGQIIISTHSPYLAALSNIQNIRSLIKIGGGVQVRALMSGLDQEDINILRREILRFRGELLFSKAIILFEGVTEEQLVPAMFEQYYGCSTFERGINCISVGGKNYAPFIKLACSLGIPVCIVSDHDGQTKQEIDSQIEKIKKFTDLALNQDEFFIAYLADGNDFEAELVTELHLKTECIEALVLSETRGSSNDQYIQAKLKEIKALSNEEILARMRSSKASYAGFLADVIIRNPQDRAKEKLLPTAVLAAFQKIEQWLKT